MASFTDFLNGAIADCVNGTDKRMYSDSERPPVCLHALGQGLVNALHAEARELRAEVARLQAELARKNDPNNKEEGI